MRENPFGEKLYVQSLGRIWGVGVLAICEEPMGQESRKRL